MCVDKVEYRYMFVFSVVFLLFAMSKYYYFIRNNFSVRLRLSYCCPGPALTHHRSLDITKPTARLAGVESKHGRRRLHIYTSLLIRTVFLEVECTFLFHS